MSEIILEVKDLTKRFGGLIAVNNVSLHLNKAEIVGLIGAIAVLFAFSAGTAAGVAALAALASVIALPFGVNRLLLSLREKQIADLPPHAKPMLTTDPKNPQFFAHLGY